MRSYSAGAVVPRLLLVFAFLLISKTIASADEPAGEFSTRMGVNTIAVSPNGKTLALAGNGLELYDISDVSRPKLTGTIKGGHSVAFSPDGKLLASVTFERVTFIQVATRNEITVIEDKENKGYLRSGAFSPDGKLFATTGINGVNIWDVASGNRKSFLKFNGKGAIWTVAFAPSLPARLEVPVPRNNGAGKDNPQPMPDEVLRQPVQLIAAANNHKNAGIGVIQVWDAETGKEKAVFKGQAANTLHFSPDRKKLVSAGKSVTIWDMGMEDPPSNPFSEEEPNFALYAALSRDGKLLAIPFFGWSEVVQFRDREGIGSACTAIGGNWTACHDIHI